MVGSDGLPSLEGHPHPRLWGTFTRVLGRYVREQSVLMAGADNVPPIDLRYSTPYGRPAQEVDIVRRQERDTMPEPRVRYAPLPTGTGGGT